ncbi:MAG: hypothetical protein ACM3KH_00395 [Thiobacillus sp.]
MFSIFRLLSQAKVDAGAVNIPKQTAVEVLANSLYVVYFAAGVTAVIVIILAGFQFSTAVYDPAKIAIAKNAILYAVVGLIVVIMAFVITQFVLGRF